jgi:predicted metal-dependent peptidase
MHEEKELRTRYEQGRRWAAVKWPYLSAALWALRGPFWRQGLGTLAVDVDGRLYADPEVVANWPCAALGAGLAHEVWHVLRDHAGRGKAQGVGPAQHDRWNRAADAEINPDLGDGLEAINEAIAPARAVTPLTDFGMLSGLLAEQYYGKQDEEEPESEQEPEKPEQDENEGKDEGEGEGDGDDEQDGDEGKGGEQGEEGEGEEGEGNAPGKGEDAQEGGEEGEGQGEGQGDAKGEGQGSEEGEGEGKGKGGGQYSGDGKPGKAGSGASGVPQPWEQWEEGDGEDGEFPGLTPGEKEAAKEAVAKAVCESRGIAPAGVARWAEKQLEPPRVPWWRLLQGAIRKGLAEAAGHVDYTHARPSRRQGAQSAVLLPSLRAPKPVVAVVIDTSGSMGESDLAAALRETQGVVKSVGGEVRVVACDAAAGQAQRVRDARRVELVGGGGTDMIAGINAALDTKPAPSVVVVLTDGYTPWPVEKIRVPLVVVLTRKHAPAPPAWARVVVAE